MRDGRCPEWPDENSPIFLLNRCVRRFAISAEGSCNLEWDRSSPHRRQSNFSMLQRRLGADFLTLRRQDTGRVASTRCGKREHRQLAGRSETASLRPARIPRRSTATGTPCLTYVLRTWPSGTAARYWERRQDGLRYRLRLKGIAACGNATLHASLEELLDATVLRGALLRIGHWERIAFVAGHCDGRVAHKPNAATIGHGHQRSRSPICRQGQKHEVSLNLRWSHGVSSCVVPTINDRALGGTSGDRAHRAFLLREDDVWM
jgi:hypothetical protein